jgi:glutaconate CoA-transferase subunit A
MDPLESNTDVLSSDRRAELSAAIAEIPNGSTVGIGGYFQHRHPMALVRELIRQRKKDLHVITPLPGIDAELMLAAGVVKRITFGFVSMDVFGQSPSFRKAVESGQVESVEFGDIALIRSLEAAERGLPGMPARAWLGSDMQSHHPGHPIEIQGESLWFTPAITPDWALVHVPVATARGDLGIAGEAYDATLVKAAVRVIASTEKVISARELRRNWNGRTVHRYASDFVVEAPFGAHPTSCFPNYVQDVPALVDYMSSVQSPDFHPSQVVRNSEDEYLNSIAPKDLLHLQRRMSLAVRLAHKYEK